jgi:phosphate transport system protein
MRGRFDRQLSELRQDIVKMAELVEAELKLALEAIETLDTELVNQVFEADKEINKVRYAIDQQCVTLIGTQQPMAGDLRALVSAMNIIVDLERMGDHAKGIAKAIAHFPEPDNWTPPPELRQMGNLVIAMMRQVITGYAENNLEVIQQVANEDDEVDKLFAAVFNHVMEKHSKTWNRVRAYEILRVAQSLERFGDLTTNIAERVVYIMTGRLAEVNVD